MRRGIYHHLFAIGALLVFLCLHLWWRWQGVAILPWPIVVPTFIAGTYRGSVSLLLLLIVIGEFFSFLPPGILTIIVLIPYLVMRFLPSGVRLWSPHLWLFIALSVSLQLLVNVMAFTWGNVEYLPVYHLVSQWTASVVATSLGVAVWQELRPSG